MFSLPQIAQRKTIPLAQHLFYIFGGSFLLALAAPVAIYLPFSPVPIVFQNTIAIMLGIILGPKHGAMSVLAFLIQGALGFPVFANLTSGIHVFFGPTGGYLVGYFFAALVAGYVSQISKRAYRNWLAMIIGSLVIYLFGTIWLSHYVGLLKAITLGVLPFIPGNALKIIAGMQVIQRICR